MTIINRPRRTGKTTELKLKIIDALTANQSILIILPAGYMVAEMSKWVTETISGTHNIEITSQYRIVHTFVVDVDLILIDECFMIEDDNQDFIIKKYKDSEIFGIGTCFEKVRELKLFSDYI